MLKKDAVLSCQNWTSLQNKNCLYTFVGLVKHIEGMFLTVLPISIPWLTDANMYEIEMVLRHSAEPLKCVISNAVASSLPTYKGRFALDADGSNVGWSWNLQEKQELNGWTWGRPEYLGSEILALNQTRNRAARFNTITGMTLTKRLFSLLALDKSLRPGWTHTLLMKGWFEVDHVFKPNIVGHQL